jgi:4-oxalocrotonate tautomerase
MPHVIVKLYAGKSEQQKKRLADAVTKAVTTTLNYGDDSVSVAIEDVSPERWAEDVYKPDIVGNSAHIYKKPGYNPFE